MNPDHGAITFYQQMRQDGGLRTGVDIDGEPALGEFYSSGEDDNPALSWYVDVRCAGAQLPAEPELVRQWLLNRSPTIRRGLAAVADELGVGLDIGLEPLLRAVTNGTSDATITIACLALRREHSRQLRETLTDLVVNWDERVRTLPILQHVAG